MRNVLSRVVLLPLNDKETIFGGVEGEVMVSAKPDKAFHNKTKHAIFIKETNNFKRLPVGEGKKWKEGP